MTGSSFRVPLAVFFAMPAAYRLRIRREESREARTEAGNTAPPRPARRGLIEAGGERSASGERASGAVTGSSHRVPLFSAMVAAYRSWMRREERRGAGMEPGDAAPRADGPSAATRAAGGRRDASDGWANGAVR